MTMPMISGLEAKQKITLHKFFSDGRTDVMVFDRQGAQHFRYFLNDKLVSDLLLEDTEEIINCALRTGYEIKDIEYL